MPGRSFVDLEALDDKHFDRCSLPPGISTAEKRPIAGSDRMTTSVKTAVLVRTTTFSADSRLPSDEKKPPAALVASGDLRTLGRHIAFPDRSGAAGSDVRLLPGPTRIPSVPAGR